MSDITVQGDSAFKRKRARKNANTVAAELPPGLLDDDDNTYGPDPNGGANDDDGSEVTLSLNQLSIKDAKDFQHAAAAKKILEADAKVAKQKKKKANEIEEKVIKKLEELREERRLKGIDKEVQVQVGEDVFKLEEKKGSMNTVNKDYAFEFFERVFIQENKAVRVKDDCKALAERMFSEKERGMKAAGKPKLVLVPKADISLADLIKFS